MQEKYAIHLVLADLNSRFIQNATAIAVQKRLMGMGYTYPGGLKEIVEPAGQEIINILHLRPLTDRPFNVMTYSACANPESPYKGVIYPDTESDKAYNHTQIEAFLEHAKLMRSYTTCIHGVNVVILPDNINLDATALLSKVSAEAKRLQDEIYGIGK
jgi:hypothetical protein